MAYKFLGNDSYSTDLNISKNNPVFGLHEDLPEAKPIEKPIIKQEIKSEIEQKQTIKKEEKYEHKCYFYSNNGDLVLVKRQLSFKPNLENSIALLLKGPLIAESKKGIYSEIPANVDLISVKRLDKDIIIDLSSNFGNGGGTKSIADRVKQLAKTVKLYEKSKNIYLYINGKEVEYLGGDGVYIKQPLE